jgi:NADH:ubiquinone oxidoreductase subunit F (NADH-binding)/(2Fe-2S) ferredoxin
LKKYDLSLYGRRGKRLQLVRAHVLVCGGENCSKLGSEQVKEAFAKELKKQKVDQEIKLGDTDCHDFCEMGPLVIVYPEGTFYVRVTPEDVPDIVEEHLINGKVVDRLLYKEAVKEDQLPKYKDLDFYKKQRRVALRNCGSIDPERLDEYVARDGYASLEKALFEFTPEQVIDEVKRSGLRGRGGGGFPTGLKWEFCYRSPGDLKYLICNADEGDPGAFMDRSVLEGDPHTLIEGMAIAAYAIGCREGYIYCRAEYPLAIKRLKIAIAQAEERGFLGDNILGSDFTFHLHIKEGAGAFVCGEETALMASIEGQRGMPRVRPPFPAQKGLWGKPSNINNVETYANVPVIIGKGADWFGSMGTEKSKGTKVFALTGKVNNLWSTVIYPGQVLLVQGGQASTPSQQYTVQAGDSLYLISKAHGTTVDAIMSLNNLWSTVIYPGQVLLVQGSSWTPNPSRGGNYTADERYLLAQMISAEAAGESFEGQVAVGAVILNRITDPRFPNNLWDVLYEPWQFEPVQNGTINLPPTASALRAADAALDGWDPVNGAVYFCNPDTADSTDFFYTLTYVCRIGNHVFYK